MFGIQKNPYRIFFFLGIIGLFIGLSVWILFGFVSPEFYLGKMHAHYMIGIFLLSFVMGFLLTAIPRMSGTQGPNPGEFFLILGPMLAASGWGFFEVQEKYFFACMAFAILNLFVFCFRRIMMATHMLPDVFPMVVISLLSGLMGAIFFILGYPDIGGRLFYLNMVLGLCVGVGARLIPMILGLGCSLKIHVAEMWLVGILLMASSFVEIYLFPSFGSFLRFIIIIWAFVKYWRAYRLSSFNSSVSVGIRIASFSILIGTSILWLYPNYSLEGQHLIYISGFSLLTLMVASRVILAHGNYDLSLEFKNKYIWIPVILIIISTATRVSAAFVEGGYERHLSYAALVFIVAGFIWSLYFVPKILPNKPPNKSLASPCC